MLFDYKVNTRKSKTTEKVNGDLFFYSFQSLIQKEKKDLLIFVPYFELHVQ